MNNTYSLAVFTSRISLVFTLTFFKLSLTFIYYHIPLCPLVSLLFPTFVASPLAISLNLRRHPSPQIVPDFHNEICILNYLATNPILSQSTDLCPFVSSSPPTILFLDGRPSFSSPLSIGGSPHRANQTLGYCFSAQEPPHRETCIVWYANPRLIFCAKFPALSTPIH